MMTKASYFKYKRLKRSGSSKVAGKTKASKIKAYELVEPLSVFEDYILSWTVPIRLKSPNQQVNPFTQHKINNQIARKLLVHMPKEIDLVSLPCEITFTRISPRRLDSDNNTFAFKYVRDCICGYLRPGLAAGRADTEEHFKFEYAQKTAGKCVYGIQISIKSL